MFDKYPYTDFHEMNLDWIIKEMKQLIEDWEEFSGRVSAEAHVSETPEVNVTGDMKDGLLFDFGLVQGPRGLTGIQGPQGPKGDTGSGLQILDIYPTLAALQSAHPTGSAGDAYLVGTEGNYVLYIWSETSSAWSNAGTLTTPSPSNSDPSMNGTAAAGSSVQYSRADHVHPSDTSKLNVSNVNGVYAVEEGSQTMIGVSDNSSPDALVRYDSTGDINGTDLNMSGTVTASRLSIMNDQVLNSDKLKALVNGGNAHQVIANNNPIDMIAMGVDAVDNTPTVAFHGVKYDNTGTMTAADAAVGFSTAFTTNYTDYDSGRIDLAPASATQIGGVKVGSRLSVASDGTINVLETLETGLLTVNSSAQSVSSHFWALDGDILTVGFKVQAPSGGFPNSTILFNLPYPAYAGSFVPLYVSSDQWLSSDVSIKYSFLTSNSTEYKVSTIPANYWVMGWFTVLISR